MEHEDKNQTDDFDRIEELYHPDDDKKEMYGSRSFMAPPLEIKPPLIKYGKIKAKSPRRKKALVYKSHAVISPDIQQQEEDIRRQYQKMRENADMARTVKTARLPQSPRII